MTKFKVDPETISKWQDKYQDEKFKAINLFITLSVATFGFLINLFSRIDFHLSNKIARTLIGFGSFLLFVCIIIFLIVLLFRVEGVSNLADISKAQELTPELMRKIKNSIRIESVSRVLFNVGTWVFGIGEIALITGFFFHLNP
jgi:hypothetical protein